MLLLGIGAIVGSMFHAGFWITLMSSVAFFYGVEVAKLLVLFK